MPLLDDLRVFAAVARSKSMAQAAREMGLSPAYVTKRIQLLETALQTKLLHRSTRRMALTEDGDRTFAWSARILGNVDLLMEDLSAGRHVPRGSLCIGCTFGFGPRFVAPAISEMTLQYPDLQIRLEVFDRPVDLVSEGLDVDIVQADTPPKQHIAKRLGSNVRILCASPDYLRRYGMPKTLSDLAVHRCLVIKTREHPFGVWTLSHGTVYETVKVAGVMSSNSGEAILQWALDGRGILLRSYWRVQELLENGSLVRVLPDYKQEGHIWAVYQTRSFTSSKLRVCVEFLTDYFTNRIPVPD